jgi:hypothetical protein
MDPAKPPKERSRYAMNIRFRRLFGLLILTILIYAGELSAKSFFVSANGTDSNSCTAAQSISTPKQHFAGASGALACLASGDTLYVRAGTYTEKIYLPGMANGTSWTSATTIMAYAGDLPSKPLLVGYIVLASLQYIIVDGINIQGTANDPTALFYLDGDNYIWYRNAEVYNGWWSGISTFQQPGWPLLDIRFTNLKIHDNGQEGPSHSGGPAHGIYISGGGTTAGGPFLVDTCELYNNRGDENSFGITVYTGDANTLNNVTIRNSIIRNNSYGAQVGFGNNHLVYNNIIKDNVGMGLDVAYGSPNNARIYNNLIYGNGWHGLIIGDYGSPTNTLIKNNIIANNGGNAVQSTGGIGSVMQTNLFYNNVSGNNTSTAMLFVNEAKEDFHLTSTSPAVNAGVPLSEVTVDFDGNARPSGFAYDIGPYKYMGSATPAPATAPAAPTNLHILP